MYNVNEIIRLSQEEGLNDRQISEITGCSRVTVTRIRKRNNIPICDKDNRKDKTYKCLNCGDTIYIRRKDLRKAFCDKCAVGNIYP